MPAANMETPQAQPQQVVAATVAAESVTQPRTYRITVQSAESAYEDAFNVVKVHDDGAYASFVSEQRTAIPPSNDAATDYAPTYVPWMLQWPMFFVGYVADSHVQRATALIYVVLAAVGIAYRESPWYWYVISGMTGDAALRVIGGDRLAVLSCLAEIVTTFIPGSYRIATAPRQFAWMLYTILCLIGAMMSGYILHADDRRIALATIHGVLLGFLSLEMIGLSLPALFFEQYLVANGWISKRYLHKSESIVATMKLKQSVVQAKLEHSGMRHTILILQEQTQKVVLRFESAVLAARIVFDPIRNCNILYCFPLLGVVALTDLFYYGSLFAGLDPVVWKTLAILLAVLYGTFMLIQGVRFYLVPNAVLREIRHPHARYAFLVILNVPLLSIDFMLSVSRLYTEVVFWMFAPLAIVFVLLILRDWIEQPMSFDAFNPAWLLATVALIVPSFELPQIYPDLAELAWLWLALALFLWPLLVSLVLIRLIFSPPLPDGQRTTLFLIVSTGAICTAAILFQNPQASIYLIGPYSSLAEFFHWFTTAFGLLCYILLLTGYFCRSPFNISYWAVSFPASALALIWLFYSQVGNCNDAAAPTQYSSEQRCTNNQDSHTLQNLVILLYVNACVTNAVLGVNSVLAIIQRRLFLPTPQWSPAALLQLQHLAFRTAIYKATVVIGRLSKPITKSSPPQTAPTAVQDFTSMWRSLQAPVLGEPNRTTSITDDATTRHKDLAESIELLTTMKLTFNTYISIKRNILWPAVQLWIPEFLIDHVEATFDIISQLDYVIAQLTSMQTDPKLFAHDSASSTNAEAIFADIRTRLNTIARELHRHLDHEEVTLTPLLYHFTDLPAANTLLKEIWQSIDTQTWRRVIPWLLTNTPDHMQRMGLIDCFNWSMQDARTLMGRWLHDAIDPFTYDQLCIDYPHLRNRAVSPYVKFW